jgi:hypothetical protein
LQRVPDDSATIVRIDSLLAYEPQMKSSTLAGHLNGFTSSHILLTRPKYPIDLAKKVEGVTSQLNANLEYQLTVIPGVKGVAY